MKRFKVPANKRRTASHQTVLFVVDQLLQLHFRDHALPNFLPGKADVRHRLDGDQFYPPVTTLADGTLDLDIGQGEILKFLLPVVVHGRLFIYHPYLVLDRF